ncbi:D-2-hydroxyacid dehydrogenase [Salipaludibacillus aurantiacus]|uniref:Phosphoglycerate dehydrogenase n=1 Tax=Salipaludibacillus aurantiacus TaxID=1601833 RepID=A0A1H9SNS1_9BACI|nr:D-2-hydroxyacid dehydrogenase [Salipaludibacillus aurantiacus]SER86544.1 Phosphoglycerate dehydrogenase [Salipaludibacillus aurantiacus]
MMVVTSAKIRRDLRHHLKHTYPDIDFRFHTHMNEANEDLKIADILITYGEDLTDSHIDSARNLKWIMVISAGLDQMPLKAIGKRGITVTSARGIHAVPMGEFALAMMLQTAKQSKALIKNEQSGTWDRSPRLTELHGKTLGILGTGAIGREIARLAKAFNMTVIGLNRSGQQVDSVDRIVTSDQLPLVLKEADFIVSVLPKVKETDQLFTEKEFKQMKEDAILINMGRGNIINETDLLKALKEKEFQHTVLDVFNEEPLPEGHPFWSEKRITVTPHISAITPQYQPRALEIFEHNLKVYRGIKNEYINLVDPQKGY